MASVFSFLEISARRYASRGAVFDGERLHATYAQLLERAGRIAARLRATSSSGERVIVVSENRPEYPEILFGIWAAGMIAVPVNAKLHPREIAEIATDSDARHLFVSPALAAGLTGRPSCIVIGSPGYDAFLAHDPAPPVPAQPDDVAWLFFTSGTTGRSKGAMLTHRNLTAMTIAHLADFEALTEEMSIIHSAPMSHGSGIYMLPYVRRGARNVIPASGGFDPAEFLDLAERHPACGAFLAPTMVRRLRIEAERAGRPHITLRSIMYGGGPMYVDELKRALACFGSILCQLYGQGEAPMTITGLTPTEHVGADDAVLGSVGWPRSGVEVAVVDADGAPLPSDEIGEIVCRGDVVMRGYWNNEAATQAALHDGWLHTGDMGSLDPTGCLTLRDRSKDLVISGGSNIYPREVEEVLLAHPGVAEVCVLGEPDAEWGETVVAVIVREAEDAVDATVLDRFCLERIARFKRPKRYVFLEALPKSNYGKVLKRELRQMLATERSD